VDTSALTAIGNDYGFEQVFSRQLRGIGRPGDVLVGISTSGNSANVVRAFEVAREIGVATVALTGSGGGRIADLADIAIRVPSSRTNEIQEMHIMIGHMLCGFVEEAVC
jgi:D-sedoheptulose 7-phosphate isomerase